MGRPGGDSQGTQPRLKVDHCRTDGSGDGESVSVAPPKHPASDGNLLWTQQTRLAPGDRAGEDLLPVSTPAPVRGWCHSVSLSEIEHCTWHNGRFETKFSFDLT